MKKLSDVIREAEECMRKRWADEDPKERPDTPESRRADEAREIARQRLPAFVNERIPLLRARVKEPAFLRAVDGWAWGSRSLALCGGTRTGKTTAAAALVRRLLGQGIRAGAESWDSAKRVRWHHAAALATARKRYPLGEREAPEVEEAMRASLLIVDDLGWDADAVVIGEVFNARYERKLPTVVTTGLDPEQLLERYGDAVFRRILEAGGNGSIVSAFRKEASANG